MPIQRVVVDVPLPDDATMQDAAEVAERIHAYADAVAGPNQFGEKFTESSGTWHMHAAGCNDCSFLSQND